MKPRGKKIQEGGDGATSSSRARPRNTARICLDGANGRDVVPSFQEGIYSIFTWCRGDGIVRDVSSIFGPDAEVVTTPRRGTFHLELEYRGRLLKLVINGRDLYVMGWRGPNGSFEIKEKTTNNRSEESRNYMLGENVRPVYIGTNYADLAPNRLLADTKLGIYEFRRAFNTLYEYKGGSPGSVKEAVGRIAVFISEATRFPFVEETVCRSFANDSVSRLKHASTDLLWLQRWSHFSGVLMQHIDCVRAHETPPAITATGRGLQIESAAQIVPMIRVLHIDAYNNRIFAHDPMPEVRCEEPIDPPEQMEGGRKRNRKEKQCQSKGEKGNEKHVKRSSAGASSSRSSRRSYSTSSVSCSTPSLDIEKHHCVENDNIVCKSMRRGCSGSTQQIEDGHKRNKKGKYYHSKGGKGNEKQVKRSSSGASSSPSSLPSYSTSSTPCSSPSMDIQRHHCAEKNNIACKSLSRGCSGSTLRYIGGAPAVHCFSALSVAHESWRQCVEGNAIVCKFLASLGRGYGRPASDCSANFLALRKQCGISYEMRRRWKTERPSSASATAARATQHSAQPPRLRGAVQVMQDMCDRFCYTRGKEYFRPAKKAPIQWAGAWLSKMLRSVRR